MKCKRCNGRGYVMRKKAVPVVVRGFQFYGGINLFTHTLKDEICPKCYGKGIK